MNWQVLLLTIFLLAFAFAGIAIKILVKKDGEFSGTCASNNPMLNDSGESCSLCGAKPNERCQNPEKED